MVDIALALLISYMHTLDAADESGRAADGLEGAYGRVDAAGNAALRALEKLLIGAHGWRSQKNGEGKPGAIAPDAPDCESVADPAPGRRRPTPGARLAPAMFDRTRSYARAILERDPAARSVWDVLFSYPGFHALMLHRVAHWLWQRGWLWLARWISH